MTRDELSKYIKNYIDNDKTYTALMLTAPWGFGKSYYVREELKPILEKNGYKCIIISIYGLRDVQEISKQIYLSLRTIKILKKKKRNSEFLSTGKIVAGSVCKTLLNAATSKMGLNFSELDEKTLQKVYESIDLSGKLIVLEDIERSEISIVDVLGYVNNLTEHDHVRVLLVANEDELIKIESQSENIKVYSEETERYLRFKEKTIGDTIRLSDNQDDAIANILCEFDSLANKYSSNSIIEIFGIFNLRTFRYACQKANELLEYINSLEFEDNDLLKKFKDNVFYGCIKQAILLSENYEKGSRWAGGKYYLGVDNNSQVHFSNPTSLIYLVFKFCFDYLLLHTKPSQEFILETYEAYRDFCLFESNQTAGDKDLSVLKSYHIRKENEVEEAVRNISKRLRNENDIPFKEYGDLIRILLHVKYRLGIPIDECKNRLIKNLKGKANLVDVDAMFAFDVAEKDSDEQNEYIEIKENIISSLNTINDDEPFGFDYNPQNIKNLEKEILNRDPQKDFISRFDLEKIKVMIARSNAENIDDFRGLFFAAYRRGVYGDHSVYYPISDKDKEIMLGIVEFISNNDFDGFDKVQLLQLYMLKDNLNEMINYKNG